jgi:hypothetical protein
MDRRVSMTTSCGSDRLVCQRPWSSGGARPRHCHGEEGTDVHRYRPEGDRRRLADTGPVVTAAVLIGDDDGHPAAGSTAHRAREPLGTGRNA